MVERQISADIEGDHRLTSSTGTVDVTIAENAPVEGMRVRATDVRGQARVEDRRSYAGGGAGAEGGATTAGGGAAAGGGAPGAAAAAPAGGRRTPTAQRDGFGRN